MDLDGFVEFGRGAFLHDVNGFGDGVGFGFVEYFVKFGHALIRHKNMLGVS